MKNDVASERNVSKEFLFKSSTFSLAFQPWLEIAFLKASRQFSYISWQIEKTHYSEFYTPKMHHRILLF